MPPDFASPCTLGLSLPICTPRACAHNSCLRQFCRPRVGSLAWLQRGGPPRLVLTFGLIDTRLALAGWGLQAGQVGGGQAQGPFFWLLCAPRSSATSPPRHIPHPGLRNPRNHSGHRTSPALIFPLCGETEKFHFPDPTSGLSEPEGRGLCEVRPLLGMCACGRSRRPLPCPQTAGAAPPSCGGPQPGVAPDAFRA